MCGDPRLFARSIGRANASGKGAWRALFRARRALERSAYIKIQPHALAAHRAPEQRGTPEGAQPSDVGDMLELEQEVDESSMTR